MTTTAVMHTGPSHDQVDTDLINQVGRYNAQSAPYHQQSTERFPDYQEDQTNLYDTFDGSYTNEHAYVHNAPTPRSNTASDGVRTRSGRSARTRTDSPFSSGKSRVSKSPGPRKKDKKNKSSKSDEPPLEAPLSVLTKDIAVPVKDIEGWANRSTEVRLKEVKENKGYIKRPMNSFMLYRSAYADRTKKWSAQNNHQILSKLAGRSWLIESDEIRTQFDEWAKLERQHHQEAHPKYKFSPSKSSRKRRKGELTDDEGDASDLDERDPDGEYRGGRQVRQRHDRDMAYLSSNTGFELHPYYGQQVGGYEQSHFQYANPGRPLPSNVAYDPQTGQPYNPQTHTWIQASPQQQYAQNPYMYQEMHAAPRVPTPASLLGQQSTMGSLGLPGGSGPEELFISSRTSTPQQYGNSVYGAQVGYDSYQNQYQQQPYHVAPTSATPQPGSQQYEHAQYLTQHQDVVDPTLQTFQLEAAAPGGTSGETHFDDALGDMTTGEMGCLPITEYYDQNSTSPVGGDATLAPTWNVAQDMK